MPHSVSRRLQALLLRKEGFSYRSVGKKLKCSTSYIQRWEQAYKKTGLVECQHGSGSPSKKSKAISRYIKNKMKGKLRASTHKIASKIRSDMGISLSRQTINNYASDMGLKPYHRVRRPLLSAKQKIKRAEFVVENKAMNWNSCIFADETVFELYPRGNSTMMLCGKMTPAKFLQFLLSPIAHQFMCGVLCLLWGNQSCSSLKAPLIPTHTLKPSVLRS